MWTLGNEAKDGWVCYTLIGSFTHEHNQPTAVLKTPDGWYLSLNDEPIETTYKAIDAGERQRYVSEEAAKAAAILLSF